MATLKVTNIKNESFAGDQLYLKTDGKIGIGTTSPANEFVISKSGSAANCKLEIVQSGGGGGTSEILFSDAVSGRGRIFYDHGSNPEGLKFEAAGTQTVIVTTGGKVGIGDTNPQSKLAVSDGGSTADPVIMAHVANSNGSLLGFGLYSTINSAYTFKVTNNGRVHAKDGVIFGTDTAAANVLDDYEEGSWTPGSNATLTANSGRYTKIGRQVTIHCRVVFASQSSSTAVNISGLPFSANMDSGLSNGAVPSGFGYISGSVINGGVQIHQQHNAAQMNFYKFGTGVTISDFSGRELRFGLVYYV